MSNTHFVYPPTPQILQWLASGQLGNRLQRSIRLWVLLHKLYGEENWNRELPQPFAYPQLRALLFAPTHGRSEQLSAEHLVANCQDSNCVCHKTLQEWIFIPDTYQSKAEWQQAVMHLTGLSVTEVEQQLQFSRPFATVHRSIREDLKQLVQMGWLQAHSVGQYQCRPIKELPTPPAAMSPVPSFAQLSVSQTWELLRVLESIAFVQPNLEVVMRSLWEQITDMSPSSQLAAEPQKRIFIHLDYILPEEAQDRVDIYQEQLESLWHKHEGGVIQFEYWVASEERKVQVTAYPVCLHYVRRAKYLSAYGTYPDVQLGWHNYRLDRITSLRLKVLAWGDPRVPKPLKELWHTGQLPTPETIDTELDAAWGFNFYLKSELLIMRFPTKFARWYVKDTERHPTFNPVAYKQLPKLIANEVPNSQERQQLLQIIKERSPGDNYYKAMIRTGDINVLMRLRDWRPNGEVIAPLSVRQQLQAEAKQELSNYS